MSRRVAITVLVALVVLAAAWTLLRSPPVMEGPDRVPDDRPATDGSAPDAAAASRRLVAGATPSRATSPRPLPSTALPLRSTLAELRARASAGEAAASCRLAAEYERCLRADALGASVQRIRDGQREAGTGPDIVAASEASLAHADARVLPVLAHCEGVPRAGALEVIGHWRRAALGGNPAAIAVYLSGESFYMADTLESLEELALYRRHAPQLLADAVAAGNVEVMWSAARAMGERERVSRGGRRLLVQVVPANPVEALVLARMAAARSPVDHRMHDRAADYAAGLARTLDAPSIEKANIDFDRRLAALPPAATVRFASPAEPGEASLVDRAPDACGAGG